MNPAHAYKYRQNSVQTASPSQLILMLFDGALRFMNGALQGFEYAEVVERNQIVHINLTKTQAIINELQNSLNLEKGGEFARTMYNLYDYMRDQIRQANTRKQAAPVQIVADLLTEIRNAWSTMLTQGDDQATTAAPWVATAA
jgi:flagellar protein FliS